MVSTVKKHSQHMDMRVENKKVAISYQLMLFTRVMSFPNKLSQ